MFDLSLTRVIFLRLGGLTKSDFLQETRLGRQCLYVLIEILGVQCLPSWAANPCDIRHQALRPQASFYRTYISEWHTSLSVLPL
jgi:hypothetical protein